MGETERETNREMEVVKEGKIIRKINMKRNREAEIIMIMMKELTTWIFFQMTTTKKKIIT